MKLFLVLALWAAVVLKREGVSGQYRNYVCDDGRCVGQNSEESDNLVGFEECRLLCGQTVGTLWPYPQKMVLNKTGEKRFFAVNLPLNIQIYPENQNLRDKWRAMNEILNKNSHNFEKSRTRGLEDSRLVIEARVVSQDLRRDLDTDESYTIEVDEKIGNEKLTIKANTIYGAQYGLYTLHQMIFFDEEDNQNKIPKSFYIKDKPAYKYRALSLETASTFLNKDTLIKMLNAMVMNKMNVFHWQITGGLAIPFQSNRNYVGAKYDKQDIKDVLNHANALGIMVVPEIQAPANIYAGFETEGSRMCTPDLQNFKYSYLNPTNEDTYAQLRDLHTKINDWFKPEMLMIGGRDFDKAECWGNNTGKEFNINYFYQQLIEKSFKVYNEMPQFLVWSSKKSNVDLKDAIYQVYDKSAEAQKLVENAKQIIVSNDDAFNLSNRGKNPTWQNVYQNNMNRFGDKNDRVIGGSVYFVPRHVDQFTMEQKVFPRICAAAERFWTNPKDANMKEVESRLAYHSRRMTKKGYSPGFIQTEACTVRECNKL